MSAKKARSTAIDHELRVGSSAHYDDPAYYRHAYEDRVHDIARYVEIAREHGGPILEYGCGAGRITLPIAQAGIRVVGVDHSRPMLAELRAVLAKEPPAVRKRVSVRRGDIRTFRIDRRFPLVIATFNTLLHLYTRDDVEQFFARVRAHLTPNGRLVFDASLPAPLDLARNPSRAYRIPSFVHPTLGVRSKYAEFFDYDPIRQILFVAMEFEPTAGEAFMTPLAHRQFFPAELEALLHYNGFEVERREGGFRREPVDRHTDTIMWFCRLRSAPKKAKTRG